MKKLNPIELSAKKKPPTEPDRTSKAIAALMLERKERENRAGKAVIEICKKENVSIVLAGLRFTNGSFVPEISIVANAESVPQK
jgi:hypothetical protein